MADVGVHRQLADALRTCITLLRIEGYAEHEGTALYTARTALAAYEAEERARATTCPSVVLSFVPRRTSVSWQHAADCPIYRGAECACGTEVP